MMPDMPVFPALCSGMNRFFGQDRIDMLVWRLKQYGLRERADYEPSLREPH
jgi:hypothetical protein